MKKINLYIGSNNKTKRLEKEKALKILAAHYEGMSVSEIVGYWQGDKEKTMLVSIMCEVVDITKLKNTCKELNRALDQQAIMCEILDSNTIFINDR